jgi:hypothetical protein
MYLKIRLKIHIDQDIKPQKCGKIIGSMNLFTITINGYYEKVKTFSAEKSYIIIKILPIM